MPSMNPTGSVKQPNNELSSNTEDLRAEISALLPCVACDGSGGYQTGEDDYEQCQYCYQFRFPAIDKLIARDSTLKAEYEEKVREATAMESVDRFEVIDNSGRAYVKGSIYGSPVSVELSLQDEGKTLKVFVKDRELNTPKGDKSE